MPANCTEPPPSVLRDMSHGQWRLYVESAKAFLAGGIFSTISKTPTGRNETHFQGLQDDFLNGAFEHGCEYFSQPVAFVSLNGQQNRFINFCDPEEPLLGGRRSVRPLCPETCGCASTVKQQYAGN